MKGLSIERLQEAHLGEVMRIEGRSFGQPWSYHSMGLMLRNPDIIAYAAVLGSRVMGYCICLRLNDEAEVLKIAVGERHRRRGVGKALAQRSIEKLRALGCRKIYLEVRRSNLGAMALYGSLGFEAVGTREAYYSSPAEDAVIMALEC